MSSGREDPLLNTRAKRTNTTSAIKEYLSKKVENPCVRGFFSSIGGISFGGGIASTTDWILNKFMSDPELYKNISYANYAIGVGIAFVTTIAIFYKLRVDVNTVSDAAETKQIAAVGLEELLDIEVRFKELENLVISHEGRIRDLERDLAERKHTIEIRRVAAPTSVLTRQNAMYSLNPRQKVQKLLIKKGIDPNLAAELTTIHDDDLEERSPAIAIV